ncbi:hypothetical protein Mapa_009535 [Marchantia paleacea]|nr:hypothetical protein Mapa_009535 [Marchantia paleacea]
MVAWPAFRKASTSSISRLVHTVVEWSPLIRSSIVLRPTTPRLGNFASSQPIGIESAVLRKLCLDR